MRFSFFIVIVFAFLAFGCSPTERVINEQPQVDWQLLALSDETPSRLSILNEPANEVAADNAFAALGAAGIGGKVGKITIFRDNMYVALPEAKKIEVLNAVDFKRRATLDFSAEGKMPVDIAFPNATTGYIAFSNAAAVGVADITVFKKVFDISVGKTPVALEVHDNQIYCALQGDNAVAVLDSRTNSVTAKIAVPAAPSFIKLAPDGVSLMVVCLGGGKTDGGRKTPPYAAFIDTRKRALIQAGTVPLSNSADSASELPRGLAVTPNDLAYIPLNASLVRIDTRSYARILVSDKSFTSIIYNPIRDEMLLTDSAASCTIMKPFSEEKQTLGLPFAAKFLFSR